MNKLDLVRKVVESNAVVERSGARKDGKINQADVNAVLDGLLETIGEALANGETVQIVGYFTVKPVGRAARVGYDPIAQTKKDIAASMAVKITAGQKFKDAVKTLNVEDFLTAEEAEAEAEA